MYTTVSDVLHAAADLIEKYGWTQGVFGWGNIDGAEEHDGRFCIEGASLAAMGVEFVDRDAKCPAFEAVRAYLGMDPDPSEESLYKWNDDLDYEGGRETVVATLRGAANLHDWIDELVDAINEEVVDA
jgi:hypothetical protein